MSDRKESNVITLVVGSSCTKWLKSDLIDNSDYFKAMFEGSYAESSQNVITLQGVEAGSIAIIQRLIWDRDYIVKEELILSVLQAACMLQFISVKESCIEQIQNLISVENCLKFWLITEHLSVKEIYLKAKLLALLEFETVKNGNHLMELEIDEIEKYLGDPLLHCDSEMGVFEVIIRWYSQFRKRDRHSLLRLMKCIDFSSLNVGDLNEMIVSGLGDLVHDLEAIKKNKTGGAEPPDLIKLSTRRNRQGFPCILIINCDKDQKMVQGSASVLHYDKFRRKLKYNVLTEETFEKSCICVLCNSETKNLKNFFNFEELLNIQGSTIIGHRRFVYVLGGEQLLGKGNWNPKFAAYDVFAEQWRLLEDMPFKRRHFQSCIVNDRYLFVIGGTGAFRTIQENLFWWDMKQGTWSNVHSLPSGIPSQLRCCSMRDALLLLNIYSKCIYLFSPTNGNYDTVTISDPEGVLPSFSNRLFVCFYNDNVYIKDNKLFKLKKSEYGIFVIDDVINLPTLAENFDYCNSDVESVICGNTIYSLVVQVKDTGNHEFLLAVLDLDTFQMNVKYMEEAKAASSLRLISMIHSSLLS